MLNWEALRFRTVYRMLLFLPYAVPGFISILVFRGLFNQNFGEINLILHDLFGIRPAWFADPILAQDHDPDREHLARLPVHHGAQHGADQGDPGRPVRGLGDLGCRARSTTSSRSPRRC